MNNKKTNKLMKLIENEIKKGNTPELYVSYEDEININDYQLDSLSNKENFINEIYENFYSNDIDYYCINDYIDYLLTFKEFEEFTKNDFYIDEIYQLISENIDFQIDKLLDNTELKAYFFPNQQENLNTEGTTLYDNILNILNGTQEKNENITPILKDLFKSQGYKMEDLKNDKLIKNSKFLQTFKNEFENLNSDACMLTILLKMNLSDFFNIYDNEKTVTINKNTTLGLYDATCGGGSMFDIELEKNFSFKIKKDYFSEFNFSEKLINYGYDIQEVYGFTDYCWNDIFKIEQ